MPSESGTLHVAAFVVHQVSIPFGFRRLWFLSRAEAVTVLLNGGRSILGHFIYTCPWHLFKPSRCGDADNDMLGPSPSLGPGWYPAR